MCVWIAALCFIYPLIVKNLFDYFLRYVAHDPLGPELESLAHVRHEVLVLLGLTELAFLVMTFLMCVFVSHRIAGPLYKLRKGFEDFVNGNLRHELKFRTKDYFQNTADDFNRMVAALRARAKQDAEMTAVAISRVHSAMDRATNPVRGELEPALVILKKIHEQQIAMALPGTGSETVNVTSHAAPADAAPVGEPELKATGTDSGSATPASSGK